MRIGIDARLWGIKHTGIGRYVEQLVKNLIEVDKKNDYVLFLKKEDADFLETPANWKKVITDITHYSLSEQIFLPFVFNKEKLDILHIPHYNVPIFYRRKFLITIHDLTWHSFKGVGSTTLVWPIYFIKYMAYHIVVNSAVNRAKKIITPSFSVKEELMKRFKLTNDKVEVTYEATYPNSRSITVIGAPVKEPYLLYVGNLYTHKNVFRMAKALKLLKQKTRMVVASSRNAFTEKFQNFVKKEKLEDLIEVKIGISDQELSVLYKNASLFVFPSLSEGFGLPGLEAMQQGTPVVCSNTPVFKEIYKDAALYFEPKDEKDIAEKIDEVLGSEKIRKDLITRGTKLVKEFSWSKMAEETMSIYEQSSASL